tara:strand:+ start:43 stop:888 length:846 start_codon:yes stop_codon:yes gene_type:complete
MIVWLASYPKSGNTWVRSMVASLLYSDSGLFNFKILSKIPQFPDNKYFKEFTSDLINFDEVMKYWIVAQDKINLDNKVKFFKTHHLNCKINKHSFTDKSNTLATIYIVRDPRSLVSSISNHYSKTTNDSKKFLLSPKIIGGTVSSKRQKINHIPALLGTWSEHYKFWTMDNENLLLIKYEDLINDTESQLERIIIFLKRFIPIKTNKEKNYNIIKTTSFDQLKSMEKKGEFEEGIISKTLNKKVDFFRLGPNNKWEDSLEKDIQMELENNFKKEMIELGYL